MLQCGLPQKPTRHAKTELGTFTRCSSSLDTSALSTGRSLTQSFTATRTSLTGESALDHDDGLSTTHTRAGPSCTSQWTNMEVQGTEVTPTVIFRKCPCNTHSGETRQAGDRGSDSCLWTEFARWLHPCTRGFSTANADIQVKT